MPGSAESSANGGYLGKKGDEMSSGQFSERVRRALQAIETKEMTRAGLRNFYANATRDPDITEAEREAVIAALEARIRISAPRDAKALFGPKDAEARALLGKIHDALADEFDLSGNTVGSGVKTGGSMISGEVYVDVYISYKGADRRHAILGYLIAKPGADPMLVVRLYQTGKEVSEPDIREDYPAEELEQACARYRGHLVRILESPQ